MKKKIIDNVVYPFCGVLLIVAVWAICAAAYDKPLILPKVSDVLSSFFAFFVEAKFYLAISATFGRSLLCYLIAVFCAVCCALLSALFKPFEKMLSPLIGILRAAPTMAVLLVAIVALTSSTVPVFVGFLMVFPIVYSAFLLNLKKVDATLGNMFKVYKVNRKYKAAYAYMPCLARTLFEQSRSALPLTVKVVISGEVLAYTRDSLGMAMRTAQLNVETDKLAAYLFVSVLLSFAAEGIAVLFKYVFGRLKLCR